MTRFRYPLLSNSLFPLTSFTVDSWRSRRTGLSRFFLVQIYFFFTIILKISFSFVFLFLSQSKEQNRLQKKRSQVFDFDTNYLLFCYFFSGDFWRECVALFSDLFLLSHGNIAFRRAKIERRAHLQSLFFRYHALLSPTLSVSH